MKAAYFYEKLLERKNNHDSIHYDAYSNGIVIIHHKDIDDKFYTIFDDGTVHENVSYGIFSRKLTIDDLDGDDFELYNTSQIMKTGYIIIKNNEIKLHDAISNLHNYIKSFGYNSENKNIPLLSGAYAIRNGKTKRFSYDAAGNSDCEVTIHTVKDLCIENINRKKQDKICIPFIKSINDEKAIHVYFVYNMDGEDKEKILSKCNECLNDLLFYMKNLNIDCEYIDCKINKSIYY